MIKHASTPTVSGAFDQARADYDMSKETRFNRRRTGLAPQGGSADYHYRTESEYYRDIEKARDMDRNDMIVGQTVTRAVNNIIQEGFTLDPQTGDKGLDQELWARWNEWASTPELCDVAEESTFHDYETQAARSLLVDGDCVVLGLDDGRLQFIEAHSVQTKTTQPDTVLGVTRDRFGKRSQYWIMQDSITATGQKEDAVAVDVRGQDNTRQLFHVYHSKRMLMSRGVTALAPIFIPSGMVDDINFAKLVQQQVVSCFAIFRKRAAVNAANLPTRNTPGYGSTRIETTASGQRIIEDIAPGMELIGDPGEELQGFSPDVPGSGYFEQVKLLLQVIGVNLGLPLCLVLMDGSETNFSGWRGAVDEARKGWKSNQRNLVKRLHAPAYRFKLSQWLAEDAAMREVAKLVGINIYGHKWNTPRWQYIDPVGDAQGDQLRMQITQTSRRRLHAEHGDEWEEIADEQIADNAYAIRNALREAASINSEFPTAGVQWFHLINLPFSAGIQMAMQDPKLMSLQEKDAAANGNQ